MADKLQYRAKIKSKGLDATGVTEAVAQSMFANLGGHTMLIVEVHHDAVTTDSEGNHTVALAITMCEPAQGSRVEDALRNMARAMYRTRPEVQGQMMLKGDEDAEEPTPEELADSLDSLVERDENGIIQGVWSDSSAEAAPDEADNVTEGPWPGDPDYVAPDGTKKPDPAFSG